MTRLLGGISIDSKVRIYNIKRLIRCSRLNYVKRTGKKDHIPRIRGGDELKWSSQYKRYMDVGLFTLHIPAP